MAKGPVPMGSLQPGFHLGSVCPPALDKLSPSVAKGGRELLWGWDSSGAPSCSGSPSGAGWGLFFLCGGWAWVLAWGAGEGLVGRRLAETGQDLLRGGWPSGFGEQDEEESIVWKKGTLLRTGE